MADVGTKQGAWLLHAGVAVVSFWLVAADLGFEHYGVPADEAVYHDTTRLHAEWFAMAGRSSAWQADVLAEHFPWTPNFGVIHPAFSRLLSALTWGVFHLGIGLDELWSLRVHNAFAYALIGVCISWFLARTYGLAAACFGVLLFWCNIRLFGHAHTAMTDVVLCSLWMLATLAMIGDEEEPAGRPKLAAVLAGLALATKLTGLLLIAVLAVWNVYRNGRMRWQTLAIWALIPAAVFFLLTPQAWLDPWGWAVEFVAGFQSREGRIVIPTLAFGERYEHRVPWYVPSFHVLITTPLALILLTLTAWVGGCVRWVRSWLRRNEFNRTWLLLFASAVAPLAASSQPGVPSHDLERLTLPLQSFLPLFATAGFLGLCRFGKRFPAGVSIRTQHVLSLALAALIVVPSAVQAALQHPYQLSYFNVLIGGAAGAEEHGFDVAYLKTEVNQTVVDGLNETLPLDAKLFCNFLYRDLLHSQQAGRLRSDIRLVNQGRAPFVVIYARRSWMIGPEESLYLRRPEPLWRLHARGADLVLLYRMRDLQPTRDG